MQNPYVCGASWQLRGLRTVARAARANMTTAFDDYQQAFEAATQRANQARIDVAIRKHGEFGRTVYSVNYACVNDSDYGRYEIVRPGTPR